MSNKNFAVFRIDPNLQEYVYAYTMQAESAEAAMYDELAIPLSEYDYQQSIASNSWFIYKNGQAVLDHDAAITKHLRSVLIDKVKQEGNRRIRTFGGKTYTPEHWVLKSQNFQDTKQKYLIMMLSNEPVSQELVERYNQACYILERKDRYVEAINNLEGLILRMNSSEIKEFNPLDEQHWRGIDL